VTASHRERMLAGEPYLAGDPELVAARERCQALVRRFNAGEPVLEELFGSVGEGAEVMAPVRCDYGTNVTIGARTFANYGLVLLDPAPIAIGADVQIATYVQLVTATHPVDPAERRSGWESAAPVTVEDGAWLGAGAIVLPGVTVGSEAVVGAGAVVTRDVPPRVVAVGNPARVVREL
jgi:maltose O-acetyltransferase